MKQLVPSLALTAALSAAIGAHSARAQCVPLSVLSARITAGSPIGGTPCVGGGSVGPSVAAPLARLPGGISPGAITGAAAAIGAISTLGTVGAAIDNILTSPALEKANRDVEYGKAFGQLMNGEIAYGQALGPACTDPNSEACWQAKLASAQYSALAECSQVWRYNVGPNNAAGDCQQAQVALQQAQQRPPVGAAAPPAPVQTGPTGIDPANVPKTVDFTNNTMTLGNGESVLLDQGIQCKV
jgi:hypothetical protein